MRKYIVVAVLAILALSVATVSFADGGDMKCPCCKDGTMRNCPMIEKGGRPGMCSMHGIMMKSMMEKEIVVIEDGSIVILSGKKLMKYDKNLELKKEVEIKCDMKEMCEKMCADCPMCQQMKQKAKQPKTEKSAKE